MYINNKCAWIEWFSVPNITLEMNTGLSRQAIIKARNVLKMYGLIDFKTNGTKATTYKMITMSKSLQVGCQDGCQSGLQVGCQDGCQNGSTLNKLNETYYFDLLLKNAREKFPLTSFTQKTKARAWAESQPEWQQLTEEQQMTFIPMLSRN